METKKVILILLTIFIVGPLVFVGACFPIGLLAFNSSANSGGDVIMFFAILIGIALALWAVIAISKRIARK